MLLGVKASVLTDDKIIKADFGCPICSRDITFTYKASLKSKKKKNYVSANGGTNVTQSNDFLVTKRILNLKFNLPVIGAKLPSDLFKFYYQGMSY